MPCCCVQVGSSLAWHTPTHPLRLDPTWQLVNVPTLIQWISDRPGLRVGGSLRVHERKSNSALQFGRQRAPFCFICAAPSLACCCLRPDRFSFWFAGPELEAMTSPQGNALLITEFLEATIDADDTTAADKSGKQVPIE